MGVSGSRVSVISRGSASRIPALVTEFRPVALGLLIAVIVLAGQRSTVVLVVATLSVIVLSRHRASRIGVAVLGASLAMGIPWILAPGLAGLAWVVARPPRRDSPSIRRIGTFRVWLLVAILGLLAGLVASLVSLMQLIERPIQLDVVQPSPYVVWIGVGVAAIVNSFGEECLWRGVLTDESYEVKGITVLATQFVSFGIAHWYGLPAGVYGLVLGGIYSCVLYVISQRFGRMFSFVAHLITDCVLFVLVLPGVMFVGWYVSPIG